MLFCQSRTCSCSKWAIFNEDSLQLRLSPCDCSIFKERRNRCIYTVHVYHWCIHVHSLVHCNAFIIPRQRDVCGDSLVGCYPSPIHTVRYTSIHFNNSVFRSMWWWLMNRNFTAYSSTSILVSVVIQFCCLYKTSAGEG